MRTKNIKISILGAGSWGTTLAVMLAAKKEHTVVLWSAFKDHALTLKRYRVNKEYLNISLPSALTVAVSLKEALAGADIVVLALPVRYIRGLLLKIKKADAEYKKKTFLSVAKGIETASLKTVSGVVREVLGTVKFCALSGPNIAREILKKLPSVAVAVSRTRKVALIVQETFSSPCFRVYTNTDVIGVELAAAVKNVIAIACGISDGLGFGTNTKAALVARGLAEMMRLGRALHASPLTFSGVAGLGDLVTTCFSSFSRNRFVGEEIARGKSLSAVLGSMNMVAEGVDSVKAAYRLSRKYRVSMPITEQVYQVLYCRKAPAQAVKDLMVREKKVESD